MKILFINPPVVRTENSSPENDFKIEGFVFHRKYRIFSGLVRLLKWSGIGKTVRYGVRAGSRWPWTADYPIGPLHYPFIMNYAVAFLADNGFKVALIDAIAEKEFSYTKFLERVHAEHADIVVIECSTPTIDIDVWIANKIAKFTKVCLAGPHLTTYAEKIQAVNPQISFLLKGEYIKSALTMAQTLRPGIYEPEIVDDLDDIPFPFRDYRQATLYYDPSIPTERPQLQIWASKGCPFKCTFCMWPQTMYQHKVSLRKPELVAKEIRQCVERYGYRSIFFDDDTFNIGTERISALCDELKKIGLPWSMMGRLDCSPTWLYDKMVDSGCVGMRFGIETFDEGVLRRIKKGLESDSLTETLAYICTKYPGLMIHLTMMKNLPGQTEEIHCRDMEILRALGFSTDNAYRSYQLSACAPFPGTEMFASMLQEYGTEKLCDFRKYDAGANTVMQNVIQ